MPLAAWRYQNPFVYKHQETSQNFFGKKEHKITSSKLVPTYLFCTHFIFIAMLLVCFILLKRIEFFLVSQAVLRLESVSLVCHGVVLLY